MLTGVMVWGSTGLSVEKEASNRCVMGCMVDRRSARPGIVAFGCRDSTAPIPNASTDSRIAQVVLSPVGWGVIFTPW